MGAVGFMGTIMIETIKAAKILIPLICLLLVSCTQGPPEEVGSRDQAQNIPAWFKDGKFGMFIHWGPYSVLGGEWKGRRIEQGDIAEWIMQRFQIPVEEYRTVAATFNPTGFDAREWVSLAKCPGMGVTGEENRDEIHHHYSQTS